MVEYNEHNLDGIFGALSDPTRRSILERLQRGRATVGDIAAPYDMSFQAISKHVRRLEAAGLIRRTKEGREVWCEMVIEPMHHASSWLEDQRAVWNARLDRLEQVLKE